MKISFLVTYYNQKEFVRQSMDSILAIEKPCDWEILVGDDGSNDGTTDVVKEYMAQYPENIFLYVMDREPDKKYEIVRRSSANRLNLIDHMSGDFFCTLDGDDRYCHTDFIRLALDIFSVYTQVSVVGFGYHTFTNKDGVLSEHSLPEGLMDTGVYLKTGLYTHAGACVYRNFMSKERKAFLHELAYYDDNNIVINNLAFGLMYACTPIIYSYRQTENSTYNAMDFAERAVLNTQSYDVDIALLPAQSDALLLRYSTSLLNTYFLRRRLYKLLGQDKFNRYLHGCSLLKNSITYLLLRDDRSKESKQQIANTIGKLIKLHPKFALRLFFATLKCR